MTSLRCAMTERPETTKQRRCKKCKEMKPETAFLKLAAPGWKVTFCDQCAGANMNRYWANRVGAADLSKIKEAKD